MTPDTQPSDHDHSRDGIRKRLATKPDQSYLRDFVFGAIDGTVTTFAVVSSVAGAGLPHGIVLVLGAANLVADGFSMAAGNYLGTRSDEQFRDRVRTIEERHISEFPEGEEEEIRQIFENKGFSGDDLENVVKVVTADRRLWIDTMVQDEYGLPLEGPNPITAAGATFLAFIAVGFVPLAPFVWDYFASEPEADTFFWSSAWTALAFFGVGSLKGSLVGHRWYLSGLETLGLGGGAAVLAYAVGGFLRGFAGV